MRNLLLVLLVAIAAHARAASLCDQLDAHIQHEEKLIALETAQGLGDNSAPRETARQLRISNSWAAITVAVQGMQANRCAPLARDVSGAPYLLQAMQCEGDRLRSSPTQTPESCKVDGWGPAH